MTRLVSVDPGLRECGVAVWDQGVLTYALLVQSAIQDRTEHIDPRIVAMSKALYDLLGQVPQPFDVVIERMEPRKGLQAAWENLIALALISGVVVALGNEVTFLRPSIWTGKRNKMTNHPRIRRKLTPTETRALDEGLDNCPPDNHKELLDAVGIGLYQLRRL